MATRALFIPTFIAVSLTPGMCMLLALTLGMTVGVRRTLWMMAAELAGVGLVAATALAGGTTLMLRFPQVFIAMKLVGGCWLLWLGVRLWRQQGKMALPEEYSTGQQLSRKTLALQGFVTAIANPKGWAFLLSLLPPFVDAERPLLPQAAVLIGLILVIELSSLLLYAGGGQRLRNFLSRRGGATLLNRISGIMLLVVGVWLIVE